MMEEDLPQKTKQAPALVTNLEHIAITLLYHFEQSIFPLPIVLAEGIGIVAEKMIEIAKVERKSMMRDVPLEHALVDTANVMESILKELIVPVAEVLCWVKELKDEQANENAHSVCESIRFPFILVIDFGYDCLV
jgi:flagellar biosynthesis protein FlhB